MAAAGWSWLISARASERIAARSLAGAACRVRRCRQRRDRHRDGTEVFDRPVHGLSDGDGRAGSFGQRQDLVHFRGGPALLAPVRPAHVHAIDDGVAA